MAIAEFYGGPKDGEVMAVPDPAPVQLRVAMESLSGDVLNTDYVVGVYERGVMVDQSVEYRYRGVEVG